MKKMTFPVLLALALAPFAVRAADPAPSAASLELKLVPGAACHVWDANSTTKPSDPPSGGFVDKNEECFTRDSLKDQPLLKGMWDRRSFIIWGGYLKIDKPGRYRLSILRDGGFSEYSTVRLIVQRKVCVELKDKDGKKSGAVSLQLTAGMHPVVIQANINSSEKLTLLCALETAVKSKVISPSVLYHQDDED